MTHILSAGTWTGAADHITLDQDGRHRRRIVMTSDHGLPFLLDLQEAVQLRHGDGLRLDDGRVVEVLAAPESLLEVRADTPAQLLKLAWHLGNRHLSAQVEPHRILIRYDHVVAHMLEHLGARVTAVTARFDPEGGAYGSADADHHHDGHHHDH